MLKRRLHVLIKIVREVYNLWLLLEFMPLERNVKRMKTRREFASRAVEQISGALITRLHAPHQGSFSCGAWSAHCPGWLKINTDASFSNREVSLGIICRNCCGVVIGIGFGFWRALSVLVAEVLAIQLAFSSAFQHKWNNFDLDSDLQSGVCCFYFLLMYLLLVLCVNVSFSFKSSGFLRSCFATIVSDI